MNTVRTAETESPISARGGACGFTVVLCRERSTDLNIRTEEDTAGSLRRRWRDAAAEYSEIARLTRLSRFLCIRPENVCVDTIRQRSWQVNFPF